jgi:hypothetical protein
MAGAGANGFGGKVDLAPSARRISCNGAEFAESPSFEGATDGIVTVG